MSDTQYKVSVVAKVTSKCFIGLVSCVVQLTACLIHFSLVYMNIELVRRVGSTVLLLCSLVSTLGLTTVKQLSVGKQSSLNVATRFRRRQTKQFTRTRRHCPPPHSRVQPPVSHQSNVQGEQQTSALNNNNLPTSSSFFLSRALFLLSIFRWTMPAVYFFLFSELTFRTKAVWTCKIKWYKCCKKLSYAITV